MPTESAPIVGNWYRHLDKGQKFEVVAIDEDARIVETQHFDGDIEEIDLDDWYELDIEPIAERVIGELERPIRVDGHDIIIGVSIGIAVFPRDGLTLHRSGTRPESPQMPQLANEQTEPRRCRCALGSASQRWRKTAQAV